MQSRLLQTCRVSLYNTLRECRQRTLELVTDINSETLCQQAHPDFSPVGWHLGHIAYTEAYWILEHCAGLPPQFPQYHQLFAANGLPKSQRQHLPPIEEILDYLAIIRKQVLTYLETAPLQQQERLWRWLIQHESQHSETITFVLQLHSLNKKSSYTRLNLFSSSLSLPHHKSFPMLEISAGEFEMGNGNIDAQDNERPVHRIYLNTYSIDVYPVTCLQYREFIAAGGYQKQEFWTKEGWEWLQQNPVSHPLFWIESPEWDNHPVCGVNWYEAEAYAKFVGKRLPTEAEWEKAGSWNQQLGKKSLYPWGETEPNSKLCNHNTLVGHTTPVTAYPAGKSAYGCWDMLGNVWEWTSSCFTGYEGFEFYPYQGYSQVYFDHKHKVLKGGSWATRPWGLRSSFRNWYHPWVRQILAGFRCAK
ncbi:protein of unknown function DUF323 [Gloeothece citriformis PCC 7424]|uniref:Sulfatase-modifying factor enzyme domain-containing protein n=1 Tax=Gloeothece citriformis (strain PCC 7424) TaxID=65393 RepID=B7KIW5_GLOC7|nr:ergothioneine biosynthesis protein EgtB [Gloeothece citriformis]ACK70801.1 protein of unknown function DUF323 [Gloeothece citriformis PCC 7424]